MRNKLTARQVATAAKAGVYGDGGGLYLRVRPSGTKSWIFVRIVDGVRREGGLGSLDDVSLSEARELALAWRKAYREGRDPIIERKFKRRSAKPIVTFGEFAEPYMARIVKGYRNDKHRKQWLSTIRTYAADLYPLPIAEIATADILEVLNPIWLGKGETAGRVRQRLERIFNAAKAEGHRDGDNPARLTGHLDQLLPRQAKQKGHHAALPYKELPKFIEALVQRSGAAARALQFTILTAARTGEALGMSWAEVDLESKIWTVPAERMKAGEEHQVPLSTAALEILEAMQPVSPDSSRKVFHNGKGSSLSNMAMTQVLRRMGHGDITVHGFRSTFRDWAGEETTYRREDAEMALAHQVGNATERAYRRGRSLDKRRAMMEDWADFAHWKV